MIIKKSNCNYNYQYDNIIIITLELIMLTLFKQPQHRCDLTIIEIKQGLNVLDFQPYQGSKTSFKQITLQKAKEQLEELSEKYKSVLPFHLVQIQCRDGQSYETRRISDAIKFLEVSKEPARVINGMPIISLV